MKSFFFLLVTLAILIAVVGGGGLIYYMSRTAEFERVPLGPPASSPERR